MTSAPKYDRSSCSKLTVPLKKKKLEKLDKIQMRIPSESFKELRR